MELEGDYNLFCFYGICCSSNFYRIRKEPSVEKQKHWVIFLCFKRKVVILQETYIKQSLLYDFRILCQ